MKAVLDTNVFISGIFWEGNFCSEIISLWQRGKFDLVSSLPIISELVRVLKSFKIRMPDEMIEEWQTMIIENSAVIEPAKKLHIVEKDPSDDKFFEAALAGDAEYIVSQDKHLLSTGKYKNVKAVTPEEFLKLFT